MLTKVYRFLSYDLDLMPAIWIKFYNLVVLKKLRGTLKLAPHHRLTKHKKRAPHMSVINDLSEIMQEESNAVAVTELNAWILMKVESEGYESLSMEEKVIIHVNA